MHDPSFPRAGERPRAPVSQPSRRVHDACGIETVLTPADAAFALGGRCSRSHGGRIPVNFLATREGLHCDVFNRLDSPHVDSRATSSPSPRSSPRPWQNGPRAATTSALFLWVVFFDQTRAPGACPWAGSRSVGPRCRRWRGRSATCSASASRRSWGHRDREAASRGWPPAPSARAGARWVPGLLLGLAEVVWFAVAASYATDFTLRRLAEVEVPRRSPLRPTISLGRLRLRARSSWRRHSSSGASRRG